MNTHHFQTLVHEAITANADYHAELCATLSDLAHVRVSKEEHTALIDDLRGKLESSARLVAELAQQTTKERKEHESLRDSRGRRFVHGILGQKTKFEDKQKKEEREYVEALQAEVKERENCQALKGQLDQAEEYMLELEKKQNVYDATASERDKLYCQIFDGFSEEIPEQTYLKDTLVEAQHNYDNVQQLLDDEHKASEHLSRAIKKMDMCENYISEAQNNSGYEMWPAAPTAFAKVQEAVKNAQATAVQVTALVNTAMRLSPTVKPVGDIDIQASTLLSGLTFSNFLTDIGLAAKLREAKVQILQIKGRIIREQNAASSQATRTAQVLQQASNRVDERRRALTNLRRAMFDRYNNLPRY